MNRKALINDNEYKFLCVNSNSREYVKVIGIIGRGGTSICYKARRFQDGKPKEWCILKEFFPDKDVYSESLYYERDRVGGQIRIKFNDNNISDAEKSSMVQKEKTRRETILTHESYISERLRFNDNSNSPYFMEAKRISFEEDMGDSGYLILDTQEGETLHAILKRDGKLSFRDSIEFFEKILEILNVLEREACYHCDIKASNLWVEGSGKNKQMILLDFGSAFEAEAFRADMLSDKDAIALADKIIYNASIGSSTEGYTANELKKFHYERSNYFSSEEFNKAENAKKLLKAINSINISVDIFSSLQLLFKMITGEPFSSCDRSVKGIVDKTGLTEIVIKQLVEIMRKNDRGRYRSVGDVKKDIDILSTLYSKGAHPKVLIDGLMKQVKTLPDIDEMLLADVE